MKKGSAKKSGTKSGVKKPSKVIPPLFGDSPLDFQFSTPIKAIVKPFE